MIFAIGYEFSDPQNHMSCYTRHVIFGIGDENPQIPIVQVLPLLDLQSVLWKLYNWGWVPDAMLPTILSSCWSTGNLKTGDLLLTSQSLMLSCTGAPFTRQGAGVFQTWRLPSVQLIHGTGHRVALGPVTDPRDALFLMVNWSMVKLHATCSVSMCNIFMAGLSFYPAVNYCHLWQVTIYCVINHAKKVMSSRSQHDLRLIW